ncbi:hypothetical protein ACAW74_04230 [Fibrella sp. WM1]|uniref:hypothetical protein n=1 Tax=Fibrella musci TaxID=3242485 RepID=UPI003522BA76
MRHALVRRKDGKHQIGGDVPQDFVIPDNEFIGGFQYVGFIDNSDPFFSWLPFRVHLIHPTYTDERFVYLDYSNPNSPTIIEPQDTASSTSAFDELDKNSKIIFEGVNVSVADIEEVRAHEYLGTCDEAEWLQEAESPSCPKSGKPMRFLCQLESFRGVEATFSNVEPTRGMADYFQNLNFWCDGSLYVFIEPATKTMYYTIQNT